MENDKEIQGWSWLGFLFMPYYYAGYGALKKGLTVAVFIGFFGELSTRFMDPGNSMVILIISALVGLSIAIYGGVQAKKQLSVKQKVFSWLNVFYAFVAYAVGVLLVYLMFLVPTSSTPKCNDAETKKLVKQIALGEFNKQGMSNLNLKLSNIRVSTYDKEIDKYECAADITVFYKIDIKLSSLSIVYTSQMIEDNEKFYVEVFGLQ